MDKLILTALMLATIVVLKAVGIYIIGTCALGMLESGVTFLESIIMSAGFIMFGMEVKNG